MLKSLLDGKLFATKLAISNKSNINAIERENLFYNSKIDKNNNNIK